MSLGAAAVIGGASLIGGAMQADSANKASKRAAKAAKFRPFDLEIGGETMVDMRRGGMDLVQDPRLSGFQNALFNMAGTSIDQLGDPKMMAKEYYDQAMNLIRPEQQAAMGGLESRLFAQGRLGTTGGAGLMGQLLGQQERARQSLANESIFKGLGMRDANLNFTRGLFTTGMGLDDPMYQRANLALAGAGMQSQAGANQAAYLSQGGFSPLGMGLMGLGSGMSGMNFGSTASVPPPTPGGGVAPGGQIFTGMYPSATYAPVG